MRRVLIGSHGLRAGWSLLMFFAILVGAIVGLQNAAIRVPLLAKPLQGALEGGAGPLGGLINEVIFNLSMIIVMLTLAKVERRRIADYGWRPHRGAARRLLLGLAYGLLIITAMYAMQWCEHVYSFGTWALPLRTAVGAGFLSAASCMLVGFFEEGVFRGYSQFTLARGIGFWPAALVISFGFGLVHLLSAHYRIMGVLSAGVFGLLFAFCLWRTGDLWLSIGIHAAVDFAELFIFAPRNSFPSSVHLFTADVHGPAWLTGSTIGPEASINGYIVLALAFVIIWIVTKKPSVPPTEPKGEPGRTGSGRLEDPSTGDQRRSGRRRAGGISTSQPRVLSLFGRA